MYISFSLDHTNGVSSKKGGITLTLWKKWFNLAIVSLMVGMLFTGCATANRNNVGPTPTRAPGAGPGVNNVGPNGWNNGTANRWNNGTPNGWNNGMANNGWNNGTNMGTRAPGNGFATRTDGNYRLADHIADKLANRRDINNATVMLTDNNAYVAVDMPGNREGDLTNDMKKSISRDVKKMDKSVNNVYVSADADFFTRMGDYARDIRNGHPIRGMADQVTETIRRVFPTAH